ncbi:MAG: glutamyl-tRNA reductase [Candidatus Rokuibacteriota bacterium]
MTPVLFAAGLSHHTAPIEVRERLVLEEDKLREVLLDLVGRGVATEIAVLSTCNRVEVYGAADVPSEARAAVFRQLGAQRGVPLAGLEPLLYTKLEEDAVAHIFRVTASLDSMLVGEPQITGQVKDAFLLAQSCGTVGTVLHAVMAAAFNVAKKVRTDTGIGRHAVSLSFAAVELARKIFGSLDGKTVLFLGAGEMAELAARHMSEHGALPPYVANRTAARGEALARELGGTAVPFDRFARLLGDVDIVIASTAAPEPIVRIADVQAALARRGRRPLFLIDLGVPRNVAPEVNVLGGVFRYDVDDLQAVVESNLRERQREAQRAERLVAREVSRFAARLRQLDVVPTIVSLKDKLESIRQAELERALARLPGATPETRQVLEQMSQSIVNKVLHAPIVKLKDSTRAGQSRRWTETISELFGLTRRDDPEQGR